MAVLSLGLRRLLETGLLLLGAVLALLACWFAVFTIFEPACTVDVDADDAVLAVRVLSGVVVLAQLLCLLAVVAAFRRASGEGWTRVAVAAGWPVGAAAIWMAWAGLVALALDALGADGGSSACV